MQALVTGMGLGALTGLTPWCERGEAVRRESPTILPEATAALSQCWDQGSMFVMCKWGCHILVSCGV